MGKNVQTCHFGYLHFIITPIFQSTVNISCHNIHVTLNKSHCKNMLLSLQHVPNMLYIPFLNLPTPHYSTTCPFTGVHTSTLVADVRSVSQVDSALRRHRFTKLLGQKKWCKRKLQMYGIHQNLKKKLTKKWCLTPGKSTFGQPKIEGWKMIFLFLLRWFFGFHVRFSGCTSVESQGLSDDCILGLGHIQCAILNRST